MNDNQARIEALNIKNSYIIQAPAGSGKTELLAQRYLKLLSFSKNPESVICLTFTKKAVAELKERIITALTTVAKSEPESPHKKRTHQLAKDVLAQDTKYNWHILKNINRLNIVTIDSLATQINNSYPQENDFAHKNMLETFAAKELYTQAAKNTLLQIEDEDSIQALLTHLDNHSENFITLIIQMLSFRDKWINKIFDSQMINLDTIVSSVENINNDYLIKIQRLATHNLTQQFFKLCLINPNLNTFTHLPKNISAWRELKNKLFTKSHTLRKNIPGFEADNKKQWIQIVANFSSDFTNFWLEIDMLPDEKINSQLLTHIAKVLLIANTELQALFSQNNQTDFTEVMLSADMALDTKHNISDINLILDYKLEHILFDEFQDTSYSQLSLIEKIVAHWDNESNKTLFLVGDPMQSIYHFRGAQVGVFIRAKEQGIANVTLHNLTLSQNFRSANNIVDTNNQIFAKLFAEKDDINSGAIQYVPSISYQIATKNAFNIHPLSHNQPEQEAEKVLEIINQNQGKEIAILCLARAHTKYIIQLLRKHNLDFEAVKHTKLNLHHFTKDLLSITKILLNPDDKLAWFSVLRSPWCGLKLNDILLLSQGSIHKQLHNNKTLSSDGFHRANQVFIAFKNAFDNFGSFAFTDILLSIVQNLAIDKTINALEEEILDKFMQIVEQCENTNQLEIVTIQNHLSDLYAPSMHHSIKIMTIYEAKGLEFEIVIIPAIGKKTKDPDKPLIQLSEFKSHGILLAPKPNNIPDKTYEYLTHIEKLRHQFEKIRLLYVAMTRAKSQIHLLGATNKSNQPIKQSFLNLLWGQYAYLWEGMVANPELTEKNITTWGRYPKVNQATLSSVQRIEQGSSINSTQLTASIIGMIIHKYLQLEKLNPTTQALSHQLLSAGISELELKNSQKIIQKMLTATQNSADFKFIFQPRKSTLVEAEFIHNQQTIIIDRLFVDNDTLWIIDFKTSLYNQQYSIEEFIKQKIVKYSKQLDNYRNILKDVYPYPIKTAIFFTNIGRMAVL